MHVVRHSAASSGDTRRDGTLIDNNRAHAHGYVDAAAGVGLEMEFDSTLQAIGKGGDRLRPEVAGVEEDSPDGERITARRKPAG